MFVSFQPTKSLASKHNKNTSNINNEIRNSRQCSSEHYDHTLDKLMDEFILNKHKRKSNDRREPNTRLRNISADDSSINLDTMWSVQNDLEGDNFQLPSTSAMLNSNNKNSHKTNNIKDINFWKSVFFNNKNGESYNDASKTTGDSIDMSTLMPSASSNSSSAENHQSDRKTRKSQNHSSAILLNNIISNLNERRTKVTNDAGGESSSLTENLLTKDLISSGLNSDPSEADSISLGSSKCSRNNNNSGFNLSSIENLLATTPSYTYLKTMKHKNLTPKRKNTITSLSSHQGESDRFSAQNDLSTLFSNNSASSENRARMSFGGASNFRNTSPQSDGNLFLEVCSTMKCFYNL